MSSRESTAALVRRIVERDPCLWYCLSEGVANLAALSRLIASRIEEITGIRPSIAAVKMALSRLSKPLKAPGRLRSIASILAASRLVLQDRVAVVTTTRDAVRRLFAGDARVSEARFLQVTESVSNATVVVSEEDLEGVLDIIGEASGVLRGQAALIMISPPEIVETPGVIAFVTGYLNYHGVNITQIISCSTDTIIVLDTEEAPEAFRALHSLIGSMRSLAGEGPGGG